ncbi:STAS domain-containing protein [Geodermatophilus sabuli]|uniref:STAS domain-containing protein n=1 Tax=Geodermatophilus sabuli TaxID=1564158 RepID=A0A7K3W1B3_9ACTN|nr:MEDS domain-containing protein [Geodermatophilus sabuli]NEK58661.1 STAS domain-containing protein [Geodermatophilus sabuli]
MRAHGVVTEPVATGSADHVCWVHDDAGSFATVAARFLAGGLARGERLLYVGDDAGIERLRRTPGPLGTLADLEARGTLTLLSIPRAHDTDDGSTPDRRQLEFYGAATRRALDEGAEGLRVVAELTPLAADPARREQLVRWEQLADGSMARGSGMSALCAYRRGALEDDVLADVAAVHPQVHVPAGTPADDVAPFRVYVDDDGIALTGSVDAFGADRLRRVLTAAPVDPRRPVVLDLRRLEFTDAAGCRAVAGWAEEVVRGGGDVRLTGAGPLFRRVWRLLGYDRVVAAAPRGEPG